MPPYYVYEIENPLLYRTPPKAVEEFIIDYFSSRKNKKGVFNKHDTQTKVSILVIGIKQGNINLFNL